MKLVKFSCGCIGTEPVEGKSVIFTVCDRDHEDNEILFYESERCSTKKHEPLDSREAQGIIEEIWKLIIDGYDFRKVKRLLQ